MATIKASLQGQVVEVSVCWTDERLEHFAREYPSGIVEVEKLDAGDAPGKLGSSKAERLWFAKRVSRLLGHQAATARFKSQPQALLKDRGLLDR